MASIKDIGGIKNLLYGLCMICGLFVAEHVSWDNRWQEAIQKNRLHTEVVSILTVGLGIERLNIGKGP